MLKCPHCGKRIIYDDDSKYAFAMAVVYSYLKYEKEAQTQDVTFEFDLSETAKEMLEKDIDFEDVEKMIGINQTLHIKMAVQCQHCGKECGLFIEVSRFSSVKGIGLTYFIEAFKTLKEAHAFHEAYDKANIVVL